MPEIEIATISGREAPLTAPSFANPRDSAYNSKNQQVKVKYGNGQTQENRYDADGLRHEMKENGKLLRFVYHKEQLLYEGRPIYKLPDRI